VHAIATFAQGVCDDFVDSLLKTSLAGEVALAATTCLARDILNDDTWTNPVREELAKVCTKMVKVIEKIPSLSLGDHELACHDIWQGSWGSDTTCRDKTGCAATPAPTSTWEASNLHMSCGGDAFANRKYHGEGISFEQCKDKCRKEENCHAIFGAFDNTDGICWTCACSLGQCGVAKHEEAIRVFYRPPEEATRAAIEEKPRQTIRRANASLVNVGEPLVLEEWANWWECENRCKLSKKCAAWHWYGPSHPTLANYKKCFMHQAQNGVAPSIVEGDDWDRHVGLVTPYETTMDHLSGGVMASFHVASFAAIFGLAFVS
jgi:hypothetical protein